MRGGFGGSNGVRTRVTDVRVGPLKAAFAQCITTVTTDWSNRLRPDHAAAIFDECRDRVMAALDPAWS